MEKYAVPNKLPSVEVSILAQRKARLRFEKPSVRRRAAKVMGAPKFKTLEAIVNKSLMKMGESKRMSGVLMNTGMKLRNPGIEEGRLVLVYQHRGKRIVNEDVLHMLKKLGIERKGNAVLLKLTEEVHFFLTMVEPWVVWGYPSLSTVTDLITKHGLFKLANPIKESAITSNKQVEELFGHLDIVCIQDLQSHIYNVGIHFEEIMKMMPAFRVTAPETLWRSGDKGLPSSRGGQAGFRGEAINELFKRML